MTSASSVGWSDFCRVSASIRFFARLLDSRLSVTSTCISLGISAPYRSTTDFVVARSSFRIYILSLGFFARSARLLSSANIFEYRSCAMVRSRFMSLSVGLYVFRVFSRSLSYCWVHF